MNTIGLIGQKLTHSFSEKYFTEKFIEKKIVDYQYQNFEIKSLTELFPLLVKNTSILGFNVTIPFKKDILNSLDSITDDAKIIGAVNTVKVIRNNQKITLQGFNTDAYGFQFSIKPFLTLHHQKALILGTGGAALAIDYVLKKLGIETLFVSRTIKNNNCILFSDLNDFAISQYKLIVNCTPVGMFPNNLECINIPYQALTANHLCVDLIYNPTKTIFLNKCLENGATILNGLSMLRLQADKAFEIFMT